MELSIVICDDEKNQTEYLAGLAGIWSERSGRKAIVSVFDSAEAFAFRYPDEISADILLLDIQMKKQSGLELARYIRKDNEDAQIIFITGFPDHVAEGYEVSALHYLLKPVDEKKLFEVLEKAVSRLRKTEAVMIIESSGKKVRLYQKDIRYIEAFAHTSVIHTRYERYEVRKSIGDIEAELSPDKFVRCHRSYIVGIRHINSITRNDVILDSSETEKEITKTIPLSRRLYDKVNKAFIKYFRE